MNHPTILEINGVSTGGSDTSSSYIPNPSTWDYSPEDVDYNSQRATDGTLHRNVVARKRTLDVSWDRLTWSQTQRISQAIKSPSFSVSFLDPEEGGMSSGTFYAGEKKFGGNILNPTTGKVYWKMSFSLIEI